MAMMNVSKERAAPLACKWLLAHGFLKLPAPVVFESPCLPRTHLLLGVQLWEHFVSRALVVSRYKPSGRSYERSERSYESPERSYERPERSNGRSERSWAHVERS